MEIKIEADFSGLSAYASNLEKQLKFAAAVALTRTAQKVAVAESRKIGYVFDRPKPETQRAVGIEKATKSNLTAVVKIKGRQDGGAPADEYLLHQIKDAIARPGAASGQRFMKRSELMLQAAGILPAGMQTAPGPDSKLDSYGNMQRGQIAQILSYFKTYGLTPLNSSRMNMGEKRRNQIDARGGYFVVQSKIGKWFPGIYKRAGKKIQFLLTFIKAPAYKARLDFFGIGQQVVSEVVVDEFNNAYDEAIRTAR